MIKTSGSLMIEDRKTWKGFSAGAFVDKAPISLVPILLCLP